MSADPIRRRVEHHFGKELKKKRGDSDDVLERFVARFATKDTVAGRQQSALDALEL